MKFTNATKQDVIEEKEHVRGKKRMAIYRYNKSEYLKRNIKKYGLFKNEVSNSTF